VLELSGPQTAPLDADGSLYDILLLQVHVICALAWMVSCVFVALLAVPGLRRVPSSGVVNTLWIRRDRLVAGSWVAFTCTMTSGLYLLFKHAVYDPPLSGSDFDYVERSPYGVPYFYALYGKIAMFLAMGAASSVLTKAVRHIDPRHVDPGYLDEYGGDEWGEFDDAETALEPVEVGPRQEADASGVAIAERITPSAVVSLPGLWASVGVLVAGAAGITFCVTLIKYFGELARAAVTYQQLRGR
jgi:hypothetical protein